MIDVLKSKGCFNLSVRYKICLVLFSSNTEEGPKGDLSYESYIKISKVIEKVL